MSLLKNLFKREDLISLERFLENTEQRKLSDEEARASIKKGIVEITYDDGQHCANGLLIGKGYFVTVKHAMEKRRNKFISDYLGRIFSLHSQALISVKKDLALGRFNWAAEDFYNYNLEEIVSESRYIPRVLLIRRGREVITKPVTLIGKNYSLKDNGELYPINNYTRNSVEGDSGGIYATVNGTIEGIHLGVSAQNTSPAIKSSEILNIVQAYLNHKRKK